MYKNQRIKKQPLPPYPYKKKKKKKNEKKDKETHHSEGPVWQHARYF